MSFYDELFCREEHVEENCGVMSGIALGEVVENWDSDHPGMVKVQLLLGELKNNDIGWVPVAVSYAGNSYGTYMLPEIGTQVLLAFFMGQIKSPYVIGCLWNQKNVLPKDVANEKNTVKTIITKGGSRITLSDEEGKERITVKTKGELMLDLDEDKQKISLMDKDGENAVFVDAKGGILTFAAKKKAVFKVNGKDLLTLDANTSKVQVKADNVSVEAGQKLALKGTASVKAESSGTMELKGSIMKLN